LVKLLLNWQECKKKSTGKMLCRKSFSSEKSRVKGHTD
jgi:hypothetical protein